MTTRRFRTVGALALAFVLLVTAAGCGDKKDSSSSDSSAGNFKACEVTDTGGVDDKSFNQTAYKGVTDAEKDLGVQGTYLESKDKSDFAPNINTFIGQNCDIIITVGFLLGDATEAAAKKNPKQDFAIVDYAYYTDAGDKVNIPNVKELTFATDQAAFLAGYLAAGMTKTGKVATFGGLQIPTVTIFMDGFRQGVDQYNTDNGTSVELLGWDGTNGQFVGNFEDQDKGKSITQSFIQEGADIIMPVAGPVGQGSIAAVSESGGKANLIWVDTDGCTSVPDSCKYFLTSVMKNMDVAVHDTIEEAQNGTFKGGLYTGTLKNNGVAIAPYHDFESEVPAELSKKIDDYKQQIIDGTYTVSP